MCITPNPHAQRLNIATIGDRDTRETFEVTKTVWDHNGTLYVSLALLGEEASDLDTSAMKRALRLARRCLIHPEKTRSSQLIRTYTDDSGVEKIVIAVSRLP